MAGAHRSPSISSESESDPGAAQFINNLSERQLQHLKFAVPPKERPQRYSQFLELPRQVPVPKRFTFDALDWEKRGREDGTSSRTESRSKRSTFAKELEDLKFKWDRIDSEGTISSSSSIHLLDKVERVAAVDWRFYATGCSIVLLNLMTSWDATSLSIALPTIATALEGSAIQTFWLGIASLLAATCSLPLFATFSDIFGRKPMILSALVFFAIGAFITAVSGNFTGLHLGRSAQGIGAGGLYVVSNLVVSDLECMAQRRKWTAILGATWAIGAISGPIIGGALAAAGQWRIIFWLNLPLCVVGFIVLPFFANLKSASSGSTLLKLRSFDWTGFVLLSGSLVSVSLGLTLGGIQHSWSNFRIILPIDLGFIGLLAFGLWSWFSPFPSLISLEGSMNLSNISIYVGAMMQGAIVFAALYFLPVYFGIAKPDHSLPQTGVWLFAWTLPLAVFAFTAFFFITQTGHVRAVMWSGWFLVTLGLGLMTLFTRTASNTILACVAIAFGSSMGALYPSLLATSTSQIVPFQNQANKTDAYVTNLTFFQTLGQTLGVVIGTTIFQNELQKQLASKAILKRFSMEVAKDAVALVSVVKDAPVVPGTVNAQIADAFVDALRPLWIVMAALAGVAFIASLFVKRENGAKGGGVAMNNPRGSYAV